MNLAERLDYAMKAREVEGQSALARASGVPQPTINRILKGKTTRPDTITVQRLADALRTPLLWLLEGDGEAPQLTAAPENSAFAENRASSKTPTRVELDTRAHALAATLAQNAKAHRLTAAQVEAIEALFRGLEIAVDTRATSFDSKATGHAKREKRN